MRESRPDGFDKVLEMIGVTTLKDSLRCARQGGVVCMTGIVGNKWSFDEFSPMEAIPTAVCLTAYAGESDDFMRTPLNELHEFIYFVPMCFDWLIVAVKGRMPAQNAQSIVTKGVGVLGMGQPLNATLVSPIPLLRYLIPIKCGGGCILSS